MPGVLTAALCPSLTPCNITGVPGAANVDLCPSLVPLFIPSLPVDPTVTTGPVATCNVTYTTGYRASVDAAGRVTIAAPSAQLGATVAVTR